MLTILHDIIVLKPSIFFSIRNLISKLSCFFIFLVFYDFFFILKKLAIYYTGCSSRPWYLQHKYLNNKRKKKRKRKEKEKIKEKKIISDII